MQKTFLFCALLAFVRPVWCGEVQARVSQVETSATAPLRLGALGTPTSPLALSAPTLSLALTAMPVSPRLAVPAVSVAALSLAAPAEPSQQGPSGQRQLRELAGALSQPDVAQPAQLASAFDGLKSEPQGDTLSEYLGDSGPLMPGLAQLEAAARTVYQRFLPRFYRPLPVRTGYGDSKLGAGASHSFDPATGHSIEMVPAEVDEKGEVASAFGSPEKTRVQQKIEQLIQFVHEFAHALFEDAVGSAGKRPAYTAFDAMTEGFAVFLEQSAIARLLAAPLPAGLTARDAEDLARLAGARREGLPATASHYAEGLFAVEQVHRAQGDEGLASLVAGLTNERLLSVERASPSYQLALGQPQLLRALLTAGTGDPLRAGLMAFELLAQGKPVTPEQRKLAEQAVLLAGPEGWRRVFAISITPVDRFDTQVGTFWNIPHWLRENPSSKAAFALAQLAPRAAEELADFIGEKASATEGLQRFFERSGPTPELMALTSQVEKLPWKAAGKAAWDAALLRWLGLGAR